MQVKRYRGRLMILLVLMTMGVIFLIMRLHTLQVAKQEVWLQNAPTEKEETVRLPAVRGNITDRNGLILATNQKNYELDINLEEVYRFYKEGWDLPLEQERLVGRKGGMMDKRSETDIAAIADLTILSRLKEYGLEKKISKNALRVHYNTHKGMIGFNYSDNLSFEQFCMFSENLESLPGAMVSVRPRRVYPYGALAGHILGNTKLWKKGDIPEFEMDLYTHYQGDMYGDSGVERTMNDYLKGQPGIRTVKRGPKNSYQGINEKDSHAPSVGAEVTLTIDAGLQTQVEKLLRNTGRAGITVMDVETGEILAMATVPSINPNDYIPRISPKDFNYYNNNKAAPFLNNAIQQHQPGSVFKLPVALAAGQANRIGYSHYCRGYETYGRTGNLKIRCHRTSGHGSLNMTSAVQKSCNPYFMSLANSLGSKRVVDMFSLLGFGRKTGISVTGEESGIIPGSLQWKRNVKPGEPFTPATLAQLSIGQADSSASTLQMAAATAAIANGGRYIKPRLVKSVVHPTKGVLIEDTPTVEVDLLKEGITAGNIQLLKKGMWRAVNEAGGTARSVYFNPSYEAAAKTGTAQTVEFGKKSNNAWTTAFAPYDNPKYAVCVVVLGGKSGGKVAGPIVRETFKALFSETAPKVQVMENYYGHINEIEELNISGDLPDEGEAAEVSEQETENP